MSRFCQFFVCLSWKIVHLSWFVPIFGQFWGCPDFNLAWIKALRMGSFMSSYRGFYRNIGGLSGLAFASWPPPPPPSPSAPPHPFPWRGHQCPHLGMRHITVIDPAKNPRPAKQFIALIISIQVGTWWQCCLADWTYGRWPLQNKLKWSRSTLSCICNSPLLAGGWFNANKVHGLSASLLA